VNNTETEKNKTEEQPRHAETYLQGVKISIDAVTNHIETTPAQHQNSGDKWIKRGAIAAIVYTVITAVIMLIGFYQSHLAQQGTIEANRAWINPFFAYLGSPLRLNEKLHYSIVYQNAGRAPASGINWRFEDGYFDTPPDDDGSKIKIGPNETCKGLRPTETGGIEFPPAQGITEKQREEQMRPHEFVMMSKTTNVDESMLNSEHRFYVQGCVAYWTMSIIGRSKFCFYYVLTDKNADLRLCPGNFAE
jgi:hypothetical protein